MALLTGKSKLDISLIIPEYKTSIGGQNQTSVLKHIFDYESELENGTGASKQDCVYSARSTLSGATNLDLRGSLADVLDGSTVSFPIVVGILIHNRSITAGETISVGAATTPFITWLKASGDGIIVDPSGVFLTYAPLNGFATTAGTADILTLTPATGTPSIDIYIFGRSA